MLKNKKLVYLLLPLNVLIWGYFIYQIFSVVGADDDVTGDIGYTSPKIVLKEDSIAYKLQLNYKDPFLKDVKRTYAPRRNEAATKDPVLNKPAIVRKETAPPPKNDIRFLGLIKNNKTGVVTGLLNVNGQSMMVKVNDVVNGFSVKSITRDSILFKKGKERMVVRK